MGAYLSPEDLEAIANSGLLDAQQPLLERQLAQAAALRGAKRTERKTPAGNLLSGLGGLLTNVSGALQENDLQQQAQALAQRRGAAEAPGRRLQALLGQQKLAAGDQDLSIQKTEAEARAADRARAGAPIAPEVESLLAPLAPGAKLRALTNRDLGAASDLARTGASIRQAGLDRAETRAQRKAAQDAAGQKRAADTEEGLRKEFTGNKVVKDTLEVATSYEKVKLAAADPSGASDMALIYGLMKMLDPGSTVREGEYATAQNSGSIPDQIVGAYNRALSGEKLAPNIRQDFVGAAGKAYQGQLAQFQKFQDTYKGLAQGSGVDPARVALQMGLGAPTPAAGAPAGGALTPEEQAEADALRAKLGIKK